MDFHCLEPELILVEPPKSQLSTRSSPCPASRPISRRSSPRWRCRTSTTSSGMAASSTAPSSSAGTGSCGNWTSIVPPCRWTRTRTARCSRPRSRSTGRTATRRSSTRPPLSRQRRSPDRRPGLAGLDPDHLPLPDPRVEGRHLPPGRLVRPLCAGPDDPLPNLDNPQKLTIGPWTHTESDFGSAAEHLRWWDRWLKGIDNGMMDDARPLLRDGRPGGDGLAVRQGVAATERAADGLLVRPGGRWGPWRPRKRDGTR